MRVFETLLGDDGEILRDPSFQVLLFANLNGALGGAIVAPILSSLIEPFGATPTSIGLIISAYAAPAIFVIPLAGVIADRFGRKPVLVSGLTAFGFGGVAIAFTTDFAVVLALRSLQGLGFAAIIPTIITSIGDIYDDTRETAAQGFRFTTTGVSQAVFPVIAGFLVVLGWRYPFFLYAISLPAAVLVYSRMDEPSPAIRDGGSNAGDVRPSVRTNLSTLVGFVSNSRVIAILVGRALPLVVWIGLLTYLSVIVVRLQSGTPQQAGLLIAGGSLVLAGSASQIGRIVAVVASPFYPLAGGAVSFGVGLSLVALSPTVLLDAVGIVLTGFGLGVTLALYRSILTNLGPVEIRGGVVSLGESLGRIAATVTPIAMGGTIQSLAPTLGFDAALRVTIIGFAAATTVASVGCLGVAYLGPGSDSGEWQSSG